MKKINVEPTISGDKFLLNYVKNNLSENLLFDLKVNFFILNFVNENFADGIPKTTSFEKLEEMTFVDDKGFLKKLNFSTIRNIYYLSNQ